MQQKTPEVVIRRLPLYLRALQELIADDVSVISSGELAERIGHSSEQIRKDLAWFGAFGRRGVGYRTRVLARKIERILGLEKKPRAVLVGAGNLGTALARHLVRRSDRVVLTDVFDRDPERIGVEIEGITVRSAEQMAESIEQASAKIGIIAVPAAEASAVAAKLVASGIQTILNFSPTKLQGKVACFVRDIDIILELQSLSYYVDRT